MIQRERLHTLSQLDSALIASELDFPFSLLRCAVLITSLYDDNVSLRLKKLVLQ